MSWSWWPSASGIAWDWAWRPQPGVWAVVAIPVLIYVAWMLRAGPGRASARQASFFAAGTLVLWASLDWPLGTLAAGYLLSARAAQYLLLTMVVAPLLLLGTPRALADRIPLPRRVGRALSHPGLTVPLLGVVLLVTFLPRVADAAAGHPGSAFLVTMAWLLSGLAFWWRLVGPMPEARRLPYLGGLVYLFLPFVFPKVPGIIFAFHDRPLYATYAGAPAALGLSHLVDQQLAGLLLWFVGSLMVIAALAVLFFRWFGEDRRMARPDSLSIPVDQRAVHLLFEVPGAWTALEHLVRVVRAALPEPHYGAELRFAYEEHTGSGGATRVLLELRVALDPDVERAFAERVEGEWGGIMRRLATPQRELVTRRLGFRLVTYGSRVG